MAGEKRNTMYAIIKTGGKQYRVAEGDVLRVEKLDVEKNNEITLSDVLMVCTNDGLKVGKPFVEGATVTARIANQDLDRKILVFHKKRRKGFQKLNGHRQPYTELKITGIHVG